MAYRDTLRQLADDTERQVLTVYRSWLDGLLDQTETIRMIAYLIAQANGRARSLADMAMALQIMVQLDEAVPVPGVDYPDDTPRLLKSASTVLGTAEASEVPEKIVARLARSEPLEAAASAATDSMVRSGLTKGWVRDKSTNACQLCEWWWREGRVWPAEHPFQHHKGCTCSPKPVMKEGIKETWKTARAKGIR
ncbi:hypothetical protein [Gordonia sp. (in: high G+C Gram-positive bacteria)]|uniref:hypothetical protein n=1 Tax=Gordonia sp. (in: high G+C Gram-positive bacteria) TaxID=84139 RepID=UPI00333EBE7A